MDTIIFNGQRFKLIPITDDEDALSFKLLETLVEPYLEYAEHIANKKPSTLKNYKHTIARFIAWQRSNSLTTITGQHWVDYYINLKKRNVSVHTVRNHRNDLKIFADWLIANGHISHNPLLIIKPPKPSKNPPLRAISRVSMQKMLSMTGLYFTRHERPMLHGMVGRCCR